MYNKIILLGNLSKDIEIRYSQSGSAIANTAIATTRKFKGADGTQKEEVLFVDVTFFGRSAEVANQYLRKGSKVLLDGRLKLDQWTTQDGSKRSKHSVTVENLQMLGNKEDNQSGGGGGYNNAPSGENYSQPAPSYDAPAHAPQSAPHHQSANIPEIDVNEDEIPF